MGRLHECNVDIKKEKIVIIKLGFKTREREREEGQFYFSYVSFSNSVFSSCVHILPKRSCR